MAKLLSNLTIRQFSRTGLLLLLCAFALNAHAGEWRVHHEKADELIGNEAYDVYTYTSDKKAFGYTTVENMVNLVYLGCVFDCDYSTRYGCFGENVIIGLYNANNELIEKTTVFMTASDKMDSLYLYEYGKGNGWNAKIINHLKTKGYVRVVAQTYSCENFDLRIPCRGK